MTDVVIDVTCIDCESTEVSVAPVIDWTGIEDHTYDDPSIAPLVESEVVDPFIDYDPTFSGPTIECEASVCDPRVASDHGIASIGSGAEMLWSKTTTWAGGIVPGDGNAVAIALGDTVHFDVDQATYFVGLDGLVVHGTLKFITNAPATGHPELDPATLSPCLALKDSTQVSGEGALYVGTSTTDPISAPAIGANYRALLRCLGTAPPGGLIDVGVCHMYGWFDTINSTTLAVDQATLSTTITLTDNLTLTAGDTIIIGAGIDQGVFIEAAVGRYTVASYDTATKVVTLTEALTDERLAGDPVAHISRPIKIEATLAAAANIPLLATRIGVFTLEGVWITGGLHVANTLQDDHTLNACTVDGNYMPAFYGNTGNVIISNSTFVGGLTDTTHGAAIDNMHGEAFLDTCVILGGEVGISDTAGAQAKAVTIQNMATACLSEIRSSLFKSCMIQGSNLGSFNGGANQYIDCTLDNNVVDFDSEYQAVTHRLTLGNPLSLGLPIQTSEMLWYSNNSYDHNREQSTHRVWCVGGYAFIQTLETYAGLPTWEFVVQNADLPIYYDTPFMVVEGQAFTISVAMKKSYLGGTAAFQIIDPAADPLFGFDDAAIAEINLPDESDHWRVLSLTYYPQATQTLIARVLAQNVVAEGKVHVQLGGLRAVQIVGDTTIVVNV